jgi:uncharacterized delta-60 repeat protein
MHRLAARLISVSLLGLPVLAACGGSESAASEPDTSDAGADPGDGDGDGGTLALKMEGQGVTAQGDHVLVVGQASARSATTDPLVSTGEATDFMVARFDRAGVLDTSFGEGGSTFVDFLGDNASFSDGDSDGAFAVRVTQEGKIVLAGYGRSGPAYTGADLALARLLPDGALDTSFGEGGRVSQRFPGNEYESFVLRALELDDTGRAYVFGEGLGSWLLRYDQDGALDTSFTAAGGAPITLDIGRPLGLALSDTRVVAGGANFALAAVTLEGAVDTSFGESGTAGAPDGTAYAMTTRADGSLVLAGVRSETGTDGETIDTLKLAAFSSSGAPLDDFGVMGVADLTLEAVVVRGVAAQADGRVLVYFQEQFTPKVARLTATGAVDESFGTAGVLTLPHSFPLLDFNSLTLSNRAAVIGDTLWIADVDARTTPLRLFTARIPL